MASLCLIKILAERPSAKVTSSLLLGFNTGKGDGDVEPSTGRSEAHDSVLASGNSELANGRRELEAETRPKNCIKSRRSVLFCMQILSVTALSEGKFGYGLM